MKIKITDRVGNKTFISIWILFHVLIAAFFCIKLATSHGQISIDADLFNITPKNIDSEPISRADEKLMSNTGNNAFILVSNPDFENAKQTAEKVFSELNGSDFFTTVSLYNDIGSYDDVKDFLYKYRWNLLDENSIDQINSETGAEDFAQDAISKAFGLFTLTSLDNIEDDPFMLAETNLTNYLNALQNSGTAMSLKDGMLSTQNDGRWYIMIRCVLSKKGNAMATKNNGVNAIYSACLPLENGETKFIFSGTAFHSNDSSAKASKEITIISVLSFVTVLVILIFIFRTPLPILCSLASIGISVATAFLFTATVFNKVMILTLVFGTSLIGSCIDYSLHYFTHWAGNPELKTPSQIRSHLFSGLSMAIISSGLCYAILLFAPFTLLKQISLFSLTGLLSSFFTTVCIYPTIPLPKGERKLRIKSIYIEKKVSNGSRKKKISIAIVAAIFVVSLASVFINKKYFGIENNIANYYKMQGRLLEDEIEAAKIIQYSPTGWFIISGENEDEALQNEEDFRKSFEKNCGNKYLSESLFIPSIEEQKKSRAACKKLLEISEEQYKMLGLDIECAKNLQKEFEDSENIFVSFDAGNIPVSLSESISTVRLGKINDKFYTVLVPNLTVDEKMFSSIAEDNDNVYFISKRSDISHSLDQLTKMVLIFFGATYIVMFIVLKFFYTWKQALKIISIPLLIILSCSSVFAAIKTKFEFFSVTGLILVFGLGLDYIIYMVENEKNKKSATKKLEPLATTLSFATTLISFGALAFSSFAPVHLIGLSISIGLTTAFVCSKCYSEI